MQLTESRQAVTVNERKYILGVRGSGTRFLKVKVKEGKKEIWSKELPYIKPTFSSGIAVGEGTIAVWGAKKEDDDVAFLVGLDAETGKQKYEVSSVRGSDHIRYMGFNNRYFLVAGDGELAAHDPSTGEQKWGISRAR
jgi:outer membrane protein assembly factor BamB